MLLSSSSLKSALEHDGIVRVYGIAEGGVAGGLGKQRHHQRLGLVMRAYEGPLDVSVLAAATITLLLREAGAGFTCIAFVSSVSACKIHPLKSTDCCWCGVSSC